MAGRAANGAAMDASGGQTTKWSYENGNKNWVLENGQYVARDRNNQLIPNAGVLRVSPTGQLQFISASALQQQQAATAPQQQTTVNAQQQQVAAQPQSPTTLGSVQQAAANPQATADSRMAQFLERFEPVPNNSMPSSGFALDPNLKPQDRTAALLAQTEYVKGDRRSIGSSWKSWSYGC